MSDIDTTRAQVTPPGLTAYSPLHMVTPYGLQNTGVICWFNSILQTMMSSTSLNKLITEAFNVDNTDNVDSDSDNVNNTDTIDSDNVNNLLTKNEFAQAYNAILKYQIINPDVMTSRLDIRTDDLISVTDTSTFMESCSVNILSSGILNWMLKSGTGEGTGISAHFGRHQEDAYEGFISMIEAFNCDDIERLFNHTYRVDTICGKCKKIVGTSSDSSSVFTISDQDVASGVLDNMSKHIVSHAVHVHDYKCEKCGMTSNARQTRVLQTIAENIVIVMKKYIHKNTMQLPLRIEIPGKNHTKMVYRLVAQVEHSGGQHGGHYWARALRCEPNGTFRVFDLNDSIVRPAVFHQTPETYLLMYHIL